MDPWIWTIIFLFAGLLFAVLELFLPSGGILAFFSFVAFCASVVFAFQQSVVFGIVFSVILLLGLPILVWQLFLLWPHTPIGRRILLDPASDPALANDPGEDSPQQLLGKIGLAHTRMMPSGIVLIDGRRFDAVSEREPIDPGAKVVVLKANRLNIIVREVSQETLETQAETDVEPEIVDPFRQ